jgi:PncC family amidohydrolase
MSGADAVPAENTLPLEAQVGALLRVHGMTIVTAESCTGGLIAARLTDVSGSSDYMLGGVVAYSVAVKQQMLGVRMQTVREHGAVSATVAWQMANGARIMFGASLAVSVTGVAGPTQGSNHEPVGLTFIGLSTPAGTQVHRYQWTGTRSENRQAATDAALRLLLNYLKDLP